MDYVYLHGFLSGPGSRKGIFLFERFRELGITLHRPDLNGHDFSRMTISSQLKIIDRILENMPGQVTLIGSSLGGYMAGRSAEKWRKVRKLVLMAPAFDFVERYVKTMSPQEIRQWKEIGYIKLFQFHYQEHRKLRFDIVEDAQKYRELTMNRQLPVQIFHGLRDESVPHRLSIDYLQSHPMTDLILLNSDHGMLDKLDVMWDYMKAFLKL